MREEGVRGLVPSHLASTEVLIDLTLAALPLLGPEPGLIRWDGQRRPRSAGGTTWTSLARKSSSPSARTG